MNNRKTYLSIIFAVLIGLILGRCSAPSGQESGSGSASAASEASGPSVWTCSMHPQIQQPSPGDCPICGMDLIPLTADDGNEGPRTFSMSEGAKALAEIQTSPVEKRYPEAEVKLVGKLDYDETKVKSLTARFPARIDELFVNFTGVPVKKGEHLARIYSPQLLTAQRELLTAYANNPNGSITNAAREKLRLWDLLPEQIDEIIQRGKAVDHIEIKAPIGGVVVSKHVKEGDYVNTGQSLFRIVDLSELWLYLDAYESDLMWLRYGQQVSFTVEAYPGEAFEGIITFIDPELNRKTRTVAIRVNVPNIDERLKPGMFAKGTVTSKLAKAGKVYASEYAGKWISPMHPEIVKDGPGDCDVCGMALVPAEELGYVLNADEAAPLVVPASAVLRTGKRSVVYVAKADAEKPTYEGRMVTIGPRAGDDFIVLEGLQEGEVVVTAGAFKIDSALQIQAKPSMMNPLEEGDRLIIDEETAQHILGGYFNLHAALAGDDFEASKEAIKSMMEHTGHDGELPKLLHQMLNGQSLDAIRKPYFETLSNSLISAVKSNPEAFSGALYLMNCPMVYDDRGADWLQNKKPLLNPYFGSSMLRCGDIVKELGKPEAIGIDLDKAKALLPFYLELHTALAGDDIDGAKAVLKKMMSLTGHSGTLPDLLHEMINGSTLDEMRKPHFETLSNAFAEVVKTNTNAFDGDVYLMNCPMVYGDRGADWLQNKKPLLNPYFGSSMLKCGDVKSNLTKSGESHEGHVH